MDLINLDLSKKPLSYPNFNHWFAEGINSEQLKTKVAPEDLWVQYGNNRKHYWTYEEYKKIEKAVLIPNGWRLPTDEEWLILLREYGTNASSDTDHRVLMSNLKLRYGGYVKEEDVLNYNDFPNDPFCIHNLGLGGYYLTSTSPTSCTDTDIAISRYLFFLKEYDTEYGYDYIGISGVMVKEAYTVRCVAIK